LKKQTRLVLIRHGQVEEAWRGLIYGSHDVELSELGRQEARAAARLLDDSSLTAVVCSPLARARYGAQQLLRKHSLSLQTDSNMREIDRGNWVGRSPQELDQAQGLGYAEWLLSPAELKPTHGESLSDLAQRVLPALDAWARKYDGNTIAIVAHCWVLRVAVCAALGLDLNQAERLQVATGSVVVLDWSAPSDPLGGDRHAVLAGMAIQQLPETAAWFLGSR